ncbi:hypothetical protein SAMN04488029_2243 [Reichenbachiella faecimaris]|uniref:Uncharacterized protein n=1 Tax=Reichenbachiella faecimaris TaxID=692418 RepID=A0A1W2GE79_REIFA|nr:hypothetical protein [Reichenbachiella faecimaris]SMD34901.1 hypothetical protein SAMN04488029_2243 [Reichenbachiella faecimaris]
MVIEIAKHINRVQALCEKHKVKELSIIDNPTLQKDQIHFMVRFDANIPTMHYADNYCQLQDEFNSLFGKTVTLWFEKSFVDIRQLEEVKQSKRLLFEV